MAGVFETDPPKPKYSRLDGKKAGQRGNPDPESGSGMSTAGIVGLGLLGTITVAAIAAAIVLGIFGTIAYANYYPGTCIDVGIAGFSQTQHREVFVFSSSLDDICNWVHYYDGAGSYSLNADRIVIPATLEYTQPPAGPGHFSQNHIATTNRWGGNHNAMDYMAQHFKMHHYCSSQVSDFSELNSEGFVVNFAIGGATANGNVYNAPSVALPHTYSQVAGNYGFNWQVTDFLTKLSHDSDYHIKPSTWFIYDFAGANDISLIATCTNITVCIANFTSVTLSNLQALYNGGMRNLIFTYINSGFEYNPATIKVDPTGGNATALDTIATLIFASSGGFLDQLNAQLIATMQELQLVLVPVGPLLTAINSAPLLSGIRPTLKHDPDPRNPLYTTTSAFPFPTYLDELNTVGFLGSFTNTFYYDDNHPTEAGYRYLAQTYETILNSQYKVCNVAPL